MAFNGYIYGEPNVADVKALQKAGFEQGLGICNGWSRNNGMVKLRQVSSGWYIALTTQTGVSLVETGIYIHVELALFEYNNRARQLAQALNLNVADLEAQA